MRKNRIKLLAAPVISPEPLVLPKPEIIPQQDPDEDSPWNVPGPKVDPTPKGKNSF